MDKEERDKNRGDTDRDEPLVADVARRHERQTLGGKLIVKLLDQRLELRAFELQSKRGNSPFEQLFLGQRGPFRRIHSGRTYHWQNGLRSRKRPTLNVQR